tara:strand:- start:210 stop:776 length:567 start_codon:yes stop_codon:yes gene_type:complete
MIDMNTCILKNKKRMDNRELTKTVFKDLIEQTDSTRSDASIIATQIENSVWDWTCSYTRKKKIQKESILFNSVYRNKAIGIYTNLNPNTYVQNKKFFGKVCNKEVDSAILAALTPQETFSENWKTLLDRKFKIDKNLYETRTEMATDMYKCGKCKKRVCTYFQLQTRSADEPMTTFVTCLKCGNRWKH